MSSHNDPCVISSSNPLSGTTWRKDSSNGSDVKSSSISLSGTYAIHRYKNDPFNRDSDSVNLSSIKDNDIDTYVALDLYCSYTIFL